MLVSIKNLALIQFVPSEAPPRLHMFKAFHESVEILGAAAAGCELFEPLAEHGVEGFMLGFGQQARLLNQLLIRTQGNVFHTKSVYTIFV